MRCYYAAMCAVMFFLVNTSFGRPFGGVNTSHNSSFQIAKSEYFTAVGHLIDLIFPEGANNGGLFGDQEIVFPDSSEIIFEIVPKINKEPRCAKGSTFCEELESYPHHILKDAVKRIHNYEDFFAGDSSPYEFTNRISEPDEDLEANICASRRRTISPQAAMNKNDKWRYIVNDKEHGYVQAIQVEECVRKDRPCDAISVSEPLMLTTICKQKYVSRRMLALSDDGSATFDTFLFPSACCCSYKLL